MRDPLNLYIPSRRIEQTFLTVAVIGAGVFLSILVIFAHTLLVFE